MKKQIGIALLATALLFGGTSLQVLASGKGKADDKFSELTDGRNENGLDTAIISNVVESEGPFYVNEAFYILSADVEIDGPLDTLKWFVNGVEYNFGNELTLLELGENEFNITAETYFKNGKKAGLIHSTAEAVTITVEAVAKPDGELLVATSTSSEWNGVGTVRVYYTITVGTQVITGDTNFNKNERDLGYKIIEDSLTFKVEYRAPE